MILLVEAVVLSLNTYPVHAFNVDAPITSHPSYVPSNSYNGKRDRNINAYSDYTYVLTL